MTKKYSHRKYIIAAAVILLFITSALVLFVFTQTRKPDPVSEKIIREATAAQIGKDPNSLTDEDFAKITELSIGDRSQTIVAMYDEGDSFKYAYNKLVDIRLLNKFTNLQTLYLGSIDVPTDEIPKWIHLFSKLGIFDLEKRFSFDLSPLEKLSHLEKLQVGGNVVIDIQPLAKLGNLKNLQLINAAVSDITPLKSLTQLEKIYIIFCPKLKYEDLEDLGKAIPNLEITSTINKPR
jgi:Leucine-rich repeat (LRR) protein